jgi:pimeloyl-ACP methyl ester carboxylesterase
VIVGHSMGGFVVQKYLESHDAPAGVLVASFPPRGTGGASLRMMKRHPWLSVKAAVTGKQLSGLNTPTLAREAFFRAHTPEPQVIRVAAGRQEESSKALLETVFPNRLKFERVTAPLLVLGAECDGGVTPREVRATARAYGTGAEFFPDMGHDMMLEPGWADVAERIHVWLGARGL